MTPSAQLRSPRARNNESGYMLLFVFALAAILAIGLYQQLPRAAFEAQREKESLLIDHGQQYVRAVQLYCRKMGRYPAKIEDLDNTQNIRFLRRHFIDPMTGKEEWRLLHMGPNGKLIDSKIQTKNTQDQWHAGSITEFKSAAVTDDGTGPEAINLAARHRPSDDQTLGPLGSAPPPNPNDPPMPITNSPNPNGTPASGANPNPGMPQPAQPGQPSWLNGGALPGMPPGMRGLTAPGGTLNVPNGGQSNSSSASNASASSGGSISGNGGFGSISGNGGFGNAPTTPSPSPNSGGGFGGQPGGFGGQPVNSQYQGQSPYSTNPGSNSNYNSGFGNPANGTSPSQMINNLLTSPRPGGNPVAGNGLPGMGGTVVGGLAGVASTYKGHGIRRWVDQDEYQKWEFFYDYGAALSGTATGTTPAPTNGSIPQQNNGSNNNGSSFGGNSSSFGGNSSSFGNSGSSFGGSGTIGGSTPPPPPPQPPPVSQ